MKNFFLQIVLLVVSALGMAVGQILFKQSSAMMVGGPSVDGLLQNLFKRWMLAALTLHAVLTVYWVWLIPSTSLSIDYPLVVLSILLTAVMSSIFCGETIRARYFVGLALLLAGVLCIVKE